MRKATYAATLAAALGFSGAALADGMYSKPAVSYKDAPSASCAAAQFKGLYLGGYVGYANHQSDITDLDYYWSQDTLTTEDTGFAGGIQVGYDWARCNTVFGVVADVTFLSTDPEESLYFGEYKQKSEIDWLSTFRLRVGAALDHTLFYLTAGIAFADVNGTVRDEYYSDGYKWEVDDTRFGYVVGAGLEHALSPRMSITAEVLYADLDHETDRDEYDEYRYKFDDEVILGKIGLNFRLRAPHQHLEPLK